MALALVYSNASRGRGGQEGWEMKQFSCLTVLLTELCSDEWFLPRDATQSAVMPQYVLNPSVCPSGTFR